MHRTVGFLIAIGAVGLTCSLLLLEGSVVEPKQTLSRAPARASAAAPVLLGPADTVTPPVSSVGPAPSDPPSTEAPAPEPAFDLGALLVHDDASALAEVIKRGLLDLHALAVRVVNASTPHDERTLVIEALALAQTAPAQRTLLAIARDALLPDDLLDLAHEALGRSRRPSPETLVHLHQTQADPRAARRGSATRALGVLAREATDPALRQNLAQGLLDELAETTRPLRRLELVRGVAETGSPQAGAPLARVLQGSASPEARSTAATGLSRVPGEAAQVSLLTLLAEGNPTDRVAAVEALGRRTHTAEAVLALCEAAADDKAPAVRAAAAQGLSAWLQGGRLPAALAARARSAVPARG